MLSLLFVGHVSVIFLYKNSVVLLNRQTSTVVLNPHFYLTLVNVCREYRNNLLNLLFHTMKQIVKTNLFRYFVTFEFSKNCKLASLMVDKFIDGFQCFDFVCFNMHALKIGSFSENTVLLFWLFKRLNICQILFKFLYREGSSI